jgi:hypothetical protein
VRSTPAHVTTKPSSVPPTERQSATN